MANERSQDVINLPKGASRVTAALGIVFFFSGFSCLIYQICWQRLLSLHYGVGAISIALIVSIYMFALGLGAWIGGLVAERIRNRVLLYFAVELLVGCFGLCSIRLLEHIGSRTAGSSIVVSFVYMTLFLCVPVLLMGTTLPLLMKIFNAIARDFVVSVSFLYFVNTLGAAFGALAASYILISFFGLDGAIYCAAAINLAIAGVVFAARRRLAGQAQPYTAGAAKRNQSLGNWAYAVVFVTGFLAIGYEIVWFRIVEVLTKASPYAFSTVLFVYLLGIALGSFGMGRYLHRRPVMQNTDTLFSLQVLLGIVVMTTFIGYYNLTMYTPLSRFTAASFLCEVHPPLAATPYPRIIGEWYPMMDIFIWPALFVLAPALLMGATFPLVSALAMTRPDREAGVVGTVYFFNIVGNVAGGVVTAFVLLGRLGTEGTIIAFSSVGVLAAVLVRKAGNGNLRLAERIGLVGLLLAANILFSPRRGELYQAIHLAAMEQPQTYVEEGVDAVVVTNTDTVNVANFINGLGHGRRPQALYVYETIEALSFARQVEDVLVIGFGAGTVVETALSCPQVKNVTVVELSSTLIKNLNKIPFYQAMFRDSRLKLIVDDGRRFLLGSKEKYDLILTDPLRATTAYSNNLYSRGFYDLAKRHLRSGGVLMAGIYEHDDDINRVMRKTAASAFDYMRVYRYFCLGSNEPFEKSDERRRQLVAGFPAQMQKMLGADRMLDLAAAELGGDAEAKLEKIYLGDRQFVEATAGGYPMNTDDKPVCEYYIGLKVKKQLGLID